MKPPIPLVSLAFLSYALLSSVPAADGPGTPLLPPQKMGDAKAGQDVFRFETFGNEGFWTDAARMLQGMADAKMTPKQTLEAGVQVDADAIPAELKEALAKELKTDLSPANAPLMNDPATAVKLIEANAVIGFVPVHADGTRGGAMKLPPAGTDKVGVSCALCHTITDKSVFDLPSGGSVGKRLDGRAGLNLNVGKLLATCANTRVFYTIVHADLGKGNTVARKTSSKPLTADSTEADFDAYFTDKELFPVGAFDDTPDGNGNPVIIPAFFRQDLAAPYGSNGQLPKLDDFNNQVFSILFDQTMLATPEGLEFLKANAGAAGEKLHAEYTKILRQTGVTGFPYVKAQKKGKVGDPDALLAHRVDDQKLLDLSAYLASLPAPKGAAIEPKLVAQGRAIFTANCTNCHNVDQSLPVPPLIIDLKTMWPAYKPVTVAERQAPMTPIQNSPGIFDDKMIVVDASPGGGIRGTALPLLLDLARRTVFLHDGSVTGGLDELLDSKRGKSAPHPFYIGGKERAAVVGFLRSLDTGEPAGARK